MKIKEGFILREVAGTGVVVPVGRSTAAFNGMITLNETGVLLWRTLEQGLLKKELEEAILAEYEVDASIARRDVEAFLHKAEEAGFLEKA